MSENAYKRWFRQQCSDDGLNLYIADALRKLRGGMSDHGFKRTLDKLAADNKRRAAAIAAQQNDSGRAA